MSHQVTGCQSSHRTSHAPSCEQLHFPIFARVYESMTRAGSAQRVLNPIRAEVTSAVHGVVLEVGAGNGLNFPFYQPGCVTHIEAIEPDAAMVRYASRRLTQARVPITLTQADVEALPFDDATFDSVLATLVWCSVPDPARGLSEVRRILKPGGTLLLVEHVRSLNPLVANLQDALVPLTTRLTGNCHWNRPTVELVRTSGFEVTRLRCLHRGLPPVFLLEARRD